MLRRTLFAAGLVLVLAMAMGPVMAAPATVRLADAGRALVPIVVGAEASDGVRATARTLADYLGKISGAQFEVGEGDGASGIVLGVPSDFEALPLEADLPSGPFERESYVLRSTGDGLWLIGASDLAVQHAAWDVLYRLGHRQFFASPTWEVVPELGAVEISVDTEERPDMAARRIWYNWGMMDWNQVPYAQWKASNRMEQGFQLNSGHSYGNIIRANKDDFDAHPEYYALIDGVRVADGESKMCLSNQGLRQLVVDHMISTIGQNPGLDSVSVDPSDGGGWCECAECAEAGSISDRVTTLANQVAEGINARFEGDYGPKFVGFYAYNFHSPPPAVRVHPRVIVSATTAFLTGGLSLDQIIEGWKDQGATLGIYDYYSVIAWDWNMPRAAKAARPHAVAHAIRDFHQKGARFYDCESGDAWGPYGLGYYVASRVMWDIEEADRVEAIVDDFLTRAFGPAREPMARFYHLISEDDQRRPTSDLLGRMYRHLAEAREAANAHADVRARIDDLILYTRYAELYNAFAQSAGDAQEGARDAMLTHTHRMRETSMIHYLGIWARTVGQTAGLAAEHPLKVGGDYTDAEIQAMLEDGIANNQPVEMGFDAVGFSEELVPSAALDLPDVSPGSFPAVPQDRQTYFIWVPDAPAEIALEVTITKLWALREPKISLLSPKDVHIEAVAESDIMKPDGQPYDVRLRTPHDGLHRVESVDGGDHTRIGWPEGMPVTLPSGIDSPSVNSHFRGEWALYFYVPEGTEVVGGWAARIAEWAPRLSGTMVDGEGNVLMDFSEREPGWFHVEVPPGQDGKLWKFEASQGTRQLMTVPPYLARSGRELLLPKEVVERDSQ
ncbi:hypothetical protein BH23VER1_BH23VER1_00390 [soil metagenome]